MKNYFELMKSKASYGWKKNGSDILLVAGIGLGIASAITACRATETKAHQILEKANHDLAEIKESEAREDIDYHKKDKTKDLMIVYTKTGFAFAKAYAVPIGLEVLSVVCILRSHGMLKDRIATLGSAYTVLGTAFSEYRKRVAEKVGEEGENDIFYGVEEKEVEEKVQDKNGKEKVVKKTVREINPKENPYLFVFDRQSSRQWSKVPSNNVTFLKTVERELNEMLRWQHYVFLNDAFEKLGMQKTKMGQLVGWIYDPENPNRDNYIDLRFISTHEELRCANEEGIIMLNPNVDGDIIDEFEDYECF